MAEAYSRILHWRWNQAEGNTWMKPCAVFIVGDSLFAETVAQLLRAAAHCQWSGPPEM